MDSAPEEQHWKTCAGCKKSKLATDEFYYRVRGKLGAHCRECNREYMEKYNGARSLDPLKKTAFRFATAKKGSELEAQLRAQPIAEARHA